LNFELHDYVSYYSCYVVKLKKIATAGSVHLPYTQFRVNRVVEEARKINQENVISLINFISGIQFPKTLTGVNGITRVSTFTDDDDRHLVLITP